MWCASSPHHITGFFSPRPASSPREAGSVGAGLALEPSLRACLGGPAPREPPRVASRAAGLLGVPGLEERVRITAPLPPGAGYAVSAATAITVSLLAAASRGAGYFEALEAAHIAEVVEGSGLGDVLALSCGVGLVLRLAPGAPGVGRVECYPVPRTVSILTVEAGRMDTRRMVASIPQEAFALAESLLERLAESPSIEAFTEAAWQFSLASGMASRLLGGERPPRVPGQIGVFVKKGLIVYVVESEWAWDAAKALAGKGWKPRVLEASSGPPRIWWV